MKNVKKNNGKDGKSKKMKKIKNLKKKKEKKKKEKEAIRTYTAVRLNDHQNHKKIWIDPTI